MNQYQGVEAMTNADIQRAFRDDQQGYLYADLKRIMANGCQEQITEDHIKALQAENNWAMQIEGWANDKPF